MSGLIIALVRAEVNWNFLVITIFKITLSTIILSRKLIYVWSAKWWRSPEAILCVFSRGAKSPWPCFCLAESSTSVGLPLILLPALHQPSGVLKPTRTIVQMLVKNSRILQAGWKLLIMENICTTEISKSYISKLYFAPAHPYTTPIQQYLTSVSFLCFQLPTELWLNVY